MTVENEAKREERSARIACLISNTELIIELGFARFHQSVCKFCAYRVEDDEIAAEQDITGVLGDDRHITESDGRV